MRNASDANRCAADATRFESGCSKYVNESDTNLVSITVKQACNWPRGAAPCVTHFWGNNSGVGMFGEITTAYRRLANDL